MKKIARILQETPDKIIFVCSSPYNILIAVSLIMKADLYGKCGLVLPTYSRKNIEYFREIALKLEKRGVMSEVINKRNMFYRAIGLGNRENLAVMDRMMKKMHTKKHAFFLVNHTWNKALVCYPASLWFRYCKEAIFVEEGCTQAATPDEPSFVLRLKEIYGNQKEFWKDKRVKGIYVQKKELFSGYPMTNLKEFKLNMDFSEQEKRELLALFVNSEDRREIEKLGEGADGIVFTQPISEDGYVKEEEKIRIFTNMVHYYAKYGNVFVKIHPRDTAEYDFPAEHVLKGSYPSELLSIIGIKFKFAVGLCTSAIETVNADTKINLNEKFLSELKYELQEIE